MDLSGEISKVVEHLKANRAVPDEDYESYLTILESFECWDSWFKLVKAHCYSSPAGFADDQCRLARVHLRYFDDVNSAAESCRAIVESTGMNFSNFRSAILDRVIELEDFASEGIILRSVWERFSVVEDRVQALERICFIYEKKNHNEQQLNYFYEKLLSVQPSNSKALRYFRTLYTQLQEWKSVIDVLSKLYNSAKHPQEGFRYAQEMAAVYLYQLEDAAEAVSIIENKCKNSTLDTSTIHYEAYYKLGDINGCLKVLRACLLNVDDDSTRSVVHYRIASLYEQQNNLQLAFENFEKSYKLNPSLLESIEGMISTGLKLKNWTNVKDWLGVLASKVNSNLLANQLRTGLSRLEEGLKDVNVG